jgi:uncharacterized protein YecE (DUF72 family)
MIRLGTSGFSYDDWVGPVYPRDLTRARWLPYYAQLFNTVELNVTYYRIPSLKTVQGWVTRTPAEFQFAMKAHRSITHDRQAPVFDEMNVILEPLKASGKLACVLAQFPHSFHPNDENRDYLTALRSGFGDTPVVIEFRDWEWVNETTFDLLEELQFGYCCVDEPQLAGLMPPVVRVTGPVAYVRFHGRNAAKWYDHQFAWERYDYTYSEDELADWIPRIRELAELAPRVVLYANNHYKGQSVETMNTLKTLFAAGEVDFEGISPPDQQLDLGFG